MVASPDVDVATEVSAMDAADQLDFATTLVVPIEASSLGQSDTDFDTFKLHAESIVDDAEEPDNVRLANAASLSADNSDPTVTNASNSDNVSRPDPTESPRCAEMQLDSDEHNVPKRRFVSPKDFELLKVIGMGAFGKVLQVRNKRTHQVLAMKVISKRILRRKGESVIENVLAERNILQRVRHPFVVAMHCSFQSREKLFIIMDFLAGGELFLRLGREGIFLEKTAAFYLAEIVSALEHLHSHGVLHRDLKPENILLGADGHVCLTDFGLAKDFSVSGGFNDDNTERALTVCGTGEYMAPEMVARMGYGRAADYWSLGCIAYEMLSGRPPFESKQGAKVLFMKIMTEKVKMPSGCSAAACRLIKGLLNRNVQARLGAAKSTMFEVGGVAGLKQVEFFAAIDWEKLACKQIDPPAVFSLDNDGDVQYFHEEFTQMSLPRSVIDMSAEDFTPRRVESAAFRGFSFIQDDFLLPDRDQVEERSYWDSIEEDGESVSECASSKMGDVANVIDVQPSVGKRPPRKRKKKVPGSQPVSAASTPACSRANTPDVSANNTPEPSETGDLDEQLKSLEINDSVAGTPFIPIQSPAMHASLPAVASTPPKVASSKPDANPMDTNIVQNSNTTIIPDQKPFVGQRSGNSPGVPALSRTADIKSKSPAQRSTPSNTEWITAKPQSKQQRATTQTSGSMRGVASKSPMTSTRPPVKQSPGRTPSGWGPSGTPYRVAQSAAGRVNQQHSPGTNSHPSSSSDWRNHQMNPRMIGPPIVPTDTTTWPTLGGRATTNLPSRSPSNAPPVQSAWASKKGTLS